MRPIGAAVAIVIAIGTASAQMPGNAVFSFFNAPRPSLGFWPIGEPRLPEREFYLWCEGPSLLASISSLSENDFAAWLTADAPATLTIDDHIIALDIFAAEYSAWSGWTVTLVGGDGFPGPFERLAAADEVVVTTPVDVFTLPNNADARADRAAFSDACEAVGFGQE